MRNSGARFNSREPSFVGYRWTVLRYSVSEYSEGWQFRYLVLWPSHLVCSPFRTSQYQLRHPVLRAPRPTKHLLHVPDGHRMSTRNRHL